MIICKPCDVCGEITEKKNLSIIYDKFGITMYGCNECLKGKPKRKAFDNKISRKEEYDRLYQMQVGVCAICGKEESILGIGGKVKRLALDHNHSTGKIRGLLCARCNSMLGMAKDDPIILSSAVCYLEEHAR